MAAPGSERITPGKRSDEQVAGVGRDGVERGRRVGQHGGLQRDEGFTRDGAGESRLSLTRARHPAHDPHRGADPHGR